MKKIISILKRNEDLIANTVFIAGLVLMGIVAYAVLSCPRAPCFGF